MSYSETPKNKSEKKRELSSPYENTEQKKYKVNEGMMLSKEDIDAITESFRNVFKEECKSNVNQIVDGVILGLNQKIEKLEKENSDLKERVTKLEFEANNNAQYSRRNNLLISGIPEHAGPMIYPGQPVWPPIQHDTDTEVESQGETDEEMEDDMESKQVDKDKDVAKGAKKVKKDKKQEESTDRKFMVLVTALKLDIDLKDIDRTHRYGKEKNGRPKDILVKFKSYQERSAFYRARVGLKKCGYKGIFVNEHLTYERSHLLYQARQLVKNDYLLGAWSFDGNIMIKDAAGKVHKVRAVEELQKLRSSTKISDMG